MQSNWLQSKKHDQALTDTESAKLVMKKQYSGFEQIPSDLFWNDAKGGQFDIVFKSDEDYEWYKSIDIDSKEYNLIAVDAIERIKTWEGLPSSFNCFWVK